MLTAAIGGPLWGQSGTSSALAGEVADRSGAAIANAAVKATEVNTGAARAFVAVRAKRREARLRRSGVRFARLVLWHA
jgi:hypothetical protein